MRILLLGHGRMGTAGGIARAGVRRDHRRRDRRAFRAEARSPRATSATSTWRSTSRWPTRCRRTCRSWPARKINVVIGTTGWQAHEAAMRDDRRERRHRRARGGEFLARHEHVPAGRRRGEPALRAARRIRRLDSRVASRDEEGRAVGDRADDQGGHGAAPVTRGRSTCRRRAPARCPARTRSASTGRRKRSSSRTRCAIARCSRAAR